MADEVRLLLEELHRSGLKHDSAQLDGAHRRRNLEPDAAALVAVIVRAMGATRMVEIGTSNGYSTIWFADALRGQGGQLLSVDIDAGAQADARGNLRQAGLGAVVELRHDDGGNVLRNLEDGSVDVLFLDAERSEYTGWWPHPRRVLRPGGLLIVDNVLSHPEEVADFRTTIEADPDLSSTAVDVGKGLLLAVTPANG